MPLPLACMIFFRNNYTGKIAFLHPRQKFKGEKIYRSLPPRDTSISF
jgi:hypothetical protein